MAGYSLLSEVVANLGIHSIMQMVRTVFWVTDVANIYCKWLCRRWETNQRRMSRRGFTFFEEFCGRLSRWNCEKKSRLIERRKGHSALTAAVGNNHDQWSACRRGLRPTLPSSREIPRYSALSCRYAGIFVLISCVLRCCFSLFQYYHSWFNYIWRSRESTH